MNVFDVVEAVISARNEDIKETFVLNPDYVDVLHEYCDVVDTIIQNHSGEEISADINPDTNQIAIKIVVFDFIYERGFKPQSYLDLMERADIINFTNCGEDKLGVEFVFPSVWRPRT